MPQEPQTASVALSGKQESMSVVDRVALRLLRIKAYGTLESSRYDEAAASQWRKVLYDHERAEWRRVACALLGDVARGDEELSASREYEVRHDVHGLHGPLDDVGDAVDFSDCVWPGSKVYERTRVTLRGEWAEVTA